MFRDNNLILPLLLSTFAILATSTSYSQSGPPSGFPDCIGGSCSGQDLTVHCRGIMEGINTRETQCLCADDLETRKTIQNTEVPLLQKAQLFGCSNASPEDLCGKLTDYDSNYTEVEIIADRPINSAGKVVLEVDDISLLQAAIRAPKCSACPGSDDFTGQDKCPFFIDTTLEGEVIWLNTNRDQSILELHPGPNNQAYVVAKGSGSSEICAQSKDVPELFSCIQIDVRGPEKVDMVFVIENSIGHDWAIGADGWGGGFIHNAQTIVDTLDQELSADTRIAIVTYNRPGIEPYNVIDDDCPSGYGVTYSSQPFVVDHLPFTSLSDTSTLFEGWSSIKATCAYSKDGDYRAASAYSAMTHSMDGESLGGWREDAKKLVILVARHRPAGPYFPDDNWLNEPEGLTGLTQDDVVNLAWGKGVEIHIF